MTAQVWLLLGITILMFAAAALVVMTKQAKKLSVVTADHTTDKNPLRFALISDIHISKMPIHWDYICTKISSADPDFLVVAGDLIFGKKDGPTVLSFFEILNQYVNCPVYITYGNHDNNKLFHHDEGAKRAFTRELESISSRIHVIENKNIIYTNNGRTIVICGLPDYYCHYGDRKQQINRAQTLAESNSYELLVISHNPEILDELENIHPTLAVFGHYHDGQVHLPGRLEFKLLRRKDKMACKGFIYGSYIYKGIPIYITSGLGNTNLAIRYKSTPEIAVITF